MKKEQQKVKIWVNAIDFPSLACSKLCLMFEENIIALSDVVLNVLEEILSNLYYK